MKLGEIMVFYAAILTAFDFHNYYFPEYQSMYLTGDKTRTAFSNAFIKNSWINPCQLFWSLNYNFGFKICALQDQATDHFFQNTGYFGKISI